MAEFVYKEGYGGLLQNFEKVNPAGPDWKGDLRLERDYKKGELVKISAWTKPNPKGTIISLRENNYTKNPDSNYPKEINHVKDSDVPFQYYFNHDACSPSGY